MNSSLTRFDKVLESLQISTLNDMQLAAIAAIPQGKDVLLLSPTGSGKTIAFLLPILERLDPQNPNIQALVIAPSRELSLQIEAVFKKMQTGFKVNCCYGGHNIQTEINNLSEPPALLIGTPGRIIDHIDRGSLDLSEVQTLVLDEFDKSLEMGFQKQMAYALSKIPHLKQRILTSATELQEIPEFVQIVEAPIRLDFLENRASIEKLQIKKVSSPVPDKLDTLLQLICHLGEQAMLIFLNHRDAVERVSEFLAAKGVLHDMFHGGLDQNLRESTLTKFRNGSTRILIATDLAARGLDIPEIEAVIHYHLPSKEDAFTHRNGRTARMHGTGSAFVILGPNEELPKYLNENLPEEKLDKNAPFPPQPAWATLYISKGKKNKINKIDVVGFLSKQGGLERDDLGLIVVKDECVYAAVKRTKMDDLIQKTSGLKIKGQKAIIEIAR